jgi:catechol 2,3-dioxygenase-like lactoylglutathione lyase family enzyme
MNEIKPGQKFNVGGVALDRPFKVRRLCHFGINAIRQSDALHFYNDLLGFRITDVQDARRGGREIKPEWAEFGDLTGYFMRYAHDHHAFVLYNHRFRMATDTMGRMKEGVTINQITWQVGSLAETVEGHNWFVERGLNVVRSGRDMPGSNWHSYLMDPDWHQNEICWGMEQIGWTGHSKPKAMGVRGFHETPSLPQKSEYAEVEDALADGADLLSGYRDRENLPLKYDVQGILLARPFRIVRHGPVNLFVGDMEKAEAWYCDVLGFVKTEEVVYQGHRCLYLRANTEHHSLALYPIALRSVLGLRGDTTMAWFGIQLANYQQLRDAVAFLRSHGVTLRELPPELSPGMDHTILALDPDGHAMHLYWSMEQVGWDGRARPAEQRRRIVPGAWPELLPATSDSYAGEPLLGPW